MLPTDTHTHRRTCTPLSISHMRRYRIALSGFWPWLTGNSSSRREKVQSVWPLAQKWEWFRNENTKNIIILPHREAESLLLRLLAQFCDNDAPRGQITHKRRRQQRRQRRQLLLHLIIIGRTTVPGYPKLALRIAHIMKLSTTTTPRNGVTTTTTTALEGMGRGGGGTGSRVYGN